MRPPGAPAEGIVLDVLCASSGIAPEIVEAAEELRVLEEVSAPVARIGHLLVLKLLSDSDSRPQDAVDIRALFEVADLGHRSSECPLGLQPLGSAPRAGG